MTITAVPLCTYLDWDSRFFGLRIARVTAAQLSAASLPALLDWCAAESIDCLYLLADCADATTIALAERHSFDLVDQRVTLEQSLGGARVQAQQAGAALIRPVRPEDVAALRAIARVTHTDTRFYADPHFPAERCAALYETWIAQSCGGEADAVLVAELAGRPVGYLTCQLNADGSGQIGLLGVAGAAQRQGIGRQLLDAALQWFADRDAQRVVVVTQGRNSGAQRLYQRGGFVTTTVQLWFHRWF